MFARMLLLAVAAIVVWAVFARPSGAEGPESRYVVRAADTLWSIADARCGCDPREGVWELQRRNGLDGTVIQPGQTLILPW